MLLKTFKARLIAISVFSVVSVLILGIAFSVFYTHASELSNLKYKVKNIENIILELRRNEKDFLSRKDLKYQQRVK